jgi:hypothetical protein
MLKFGYLDKNIQKGALMMKIKQLKSVTNVQASYC